MNTVVFVFPDEVQRNIFIEKLQKSDDDILRAACENMQLDPKDAIYALFVAGKKLVEGSLEQMDLRFKQETGSHSASVELRRYHLGQWTPIRSRRIQR